MSEHLSVRINQPDEFDRAVHGDDSVRSLPSSDDLTIVTKDGGMESGRAVACITFTCQHEGRLYRAQYTVPVRLLKTALRAIDAGYDDDGMPIPGTFGRGSTS